MRSIDEDESTEEVLPDEANGESRLDLSSGQEKGKELNIANVSGIQNWIMKRAGQ
jgi:hypothetical protein